jgi:hypothetical protein
VLIIFNGLYRKQDFFGAVALASILAKRINPWAWMRQFLELNHKVKTTGELSASGAVIHGGIGKRQKKSSSHLWLTQALFMNHSFKETRNSLKKTA